MYSVIALTALVLGSISLLLSCVGLIFVIGLKNSTHQVVWKEIEPKLEKEDTFEIRDSAPDYNPNKRMKKEEPFVDLADPSETANNW